MNLIKAAGQLREKNATYVPANDYNNQDLS